VFFRQAVPRAALTARISGPLGSRVRNNPLHSVSFPKSGPSLHTWYQWFYGADDAVDENAWSQPDLNRYYFTRQTQERLQPQSDHPDSDIDHEQRARQRHG
jgi:hypothetical protein